MKAGFGKGVIRFPESMFPLEGFSGIHDDPHVRLMVLQLKDAAFALLEAELVIVPRVSVENWRRMVSEAFRIPVEQIVVQMTHAFTTPHEPGPMGPPHLRPEPTEEDLRKRAIYHKATDQAVEEAVREAHADLSDAFFGWGSGPCTINANCDVETPFGWWLGRNEEGCSNHTMTVLCVNDSQGGIKGVLVSFGMKPAAIDNAGRKENRRLISSEVAGVFCKRMEEIYGVPVIYAVSAGGNQIPRQTAVKHFVTDAGETREMDEGPERGFVYAQLQGEEMCASARKIVDAVRCGENTAECRWTDCSLKWTRRRGGPRKLTKEIAHQPEGTAMLTADLFRMGETVFVMVRPEMTAEAEQMLLASNPGRRIVLMTLTNGEMKCVPEKDAFLRCTYEAQGSNLRPGAAEALITAVTDKISEL